jgi:hypothetical protein
MQIETCETQGRILALEVRPRASGFAVFETNSQLLDWGMRKHHGKRDALSNVAAKKIGALLEVHQPTILLARVRTIRSAAARDRISTIFQVMRTEARKRFIEFRLTSTNSVRRYFADYDCNSKYQRAALIARWFPELLSKLPPKYKVWKSEHHRMLFFDAMSTALAFMNRSPPKKE